ncbi:MAG: 1-acyl-sn-glycerol-3-phosphate acyltransferase, partial [Spartobacteria bacterium]|nr:1-acyl-sn-glycerol-3-phosphate acyltransferase [Spartobacteria bacterium]
MKVIFGPVARVHVVGRENIERDGGFLLAANHISHFDPLIISSVVRRKIDWMAMAEFFGYRFVGFFLRAVDAFPAERDRADLKTIRTAIARLKQGRIVGLFPEGGIRDGAASLLEGAPLRPGASALAQIAQVPIVPCVILGTDRLYVKQSWLSFRSTPVWIAFGSPIFPGQKLNKTHEGIERELGSAFLRLYSHLRQQFGLGSDDLPQPPKKRMARLVGSPRETRCRSSKLSHFTAFAVDSVMCASMNLVQSRHRLNHRSKDGFDRYLASCEKLTLDEFYAAPPNSDLTN